MAGNKNALSSQLKQLGVVTTIPIILLIGPMVGYFIGSWVDRKLLIYPWVTIILVGLGFVGSGREVVRLLKETLKEDSSDSTKK